jgi:hypothetical protein
MLWFAPMYHGCSFNDENVNVAETGHSVKKKLRSALEALELL